MYDEVMQPGRRSAPNRRFKFQKRRQLFIRSHNETLSASQDRARIVFDCRMANDSAMMASTIPARFLVKSPEGEANAGQKVSQSNLESLFLTTAAS